MHIPRFSPLWVLFAALAVVAVPAVAAGGTCATAQVGEPFVLPDGSRHAAGLLKLCQESSFSPVASFNSAFVDRHPVALFISHHETVEPTPGSDYYLLFARSADRQLRLIGYTVPNGARTESHVLDRPRVTVKQFLDPDPPRSRSEDTLVFLPATLD